MVRGEGRGKRRESAMGRLFRLKVSESFARSHAGLRGRGARVGAEERVPSPLRTSALSQNVTVASFEHVDVPASQTLYVYEPPPRLLIASVWKPSFAVVATRAPFR